MDNKYNRALQKSTKEAKAFKPKKVDSILSKTAKMIMKNMHIKTVVSDVKLMLEMCKYTLTPNSPFKIEMKEFYTIVGALLYLVSPIDLIPDILGAIGFTDDIVVIQVALSQVSHAVTRFKQYKEVNRI